MNVAELRRLLEGGGEAQPARVEVAAEELLQAGLVNRQLPALQPFDLALVHVQTEHFEAQFGHARRVCSTQVSGPQNSEAVRHGMLPSYRLFVIWHGTGPVNCPESHLGKPAPWPPRYGSGRARSTPRHHFLTPCQGDVSGKAPY
ncbi:hypothetical protein GCM10027612_23500 [Microbispora bryophytorum subsp. camponoti]